MADINESELIERGAIPPDDFHDSIQRLREIAPFELEIPLDFEARLSHAIDGLVIPESVLMAAAAAIRVGHVVFQGPPGTGKSSLARALCNAFNVTTFAVTAHEDWTIYDVIGRLELRLTEDRKEVITPVNGSLTEAVIRCGNNVVRHFDDPLHPQAEWLMIDELNRAHLDRAFGELFSVLGTDDLVPINLPHQIEGNRELVIPRRFRIVATLNSYDRQFVQSLSQAIRRRFTFISLDMLPKRPPGTPWAYDLKSLIPAIQEFSRVIQQAATRVARRENSMDVEKIKEVADQLTEQLCSKYLEPISRLFEFVETVRYATEKSEVPHLPIGTAQLVDTLDLFLTRVRQDGGPETGYPRHMDWAASVKLVPLFESDVLSPDQLGNLANTLPAPFDVLTKRALSVIVASGMHFVPDAQ